MKPRILILALALSLTVPFAACTSMNKTQQGALSGGVLGGAAGAGIAAIAGGHAVVGAAIGGVLGAAAGGIYGHNK